jgi:hypothetical protein
MEHKIIKIDNLNLVLPIMWKLIEDYKKAGYYGWEMQTMTIIKTGEQYTLGHIDQIINN